MPVQIHPDPDGGTPEPERPLDHLSDYRNARPVRVGNGAFGPHQHDVWGMILWREAAPGLVRFTGPSRARGAAN